MSLFSEERIKSAGLLFTKGRRLIDERRTDVQKLLMNKLTVVEAEGCAISYGFCLTVTESESGTRAWLCETEGCLRPPLPVTRKCRECLLFDDDDFMDTPSLKRHLSIQSSGSSLGPFPPKKKSRHCISLYDSETSELDETRSPQQLSTVTSPLQMVETVCDPSGSFEGTGFDIIDICSAPMGSNKLTPSKSQLKSLVQPPDVTAHEVEEKMETRGPDETIEGDEVEMEFELSEMFRPVADSPETQKEDERPKPVTNKDLYSAFKLPQLF